MRLLCALALGASSLAAPPSLEDMCGEWQDVGVLRATPPLSSPRGSLLVGHDVLSVGSLTFAPYVVGTSSLHIEEDSWLKDPQRPDHGEPNFPDDNTGYSGQLYVGGKPVVSTQSRWCPHRIERIGHAVVPGTTQEVAVHTTVALDQFERAVYINVQIVKSSKVPEQVTLDFDLDMQAIPRMFNGSEDWAFGHSTALQNQTDEFTVRRLGPSAVSILDQQTSAAAVIELTMQPDTITLAPSVAGSNVSLVGGRASFRAVLDHASPSVTVGVVIAVASTVEIAAASAASKASVQTQMDRAASDWGDRWEAAFTPGNKHYSGHLPTLETADADMAHVYYLGVLSLLCLEKNVTDTHTQTTWTRAYVTGGPRTAVTANFLWDMPYQSTLLSLLDPAFVRGYILKALLVNIYASNAIDFMSGEGRGRWYSFNDLSVFTLIRNYVRISDDDSLLLEVAIPSDTTCSDHNYNCTVLGWLHATANHYQQLNTTAGLSDYGENQNLLECVPRYQHCVPSLNAANVWMGQTLADIYQRLLDDTASANHKVFTQIIAASSVKQDPRREISRLRKASAGIFTALQKQYTAGQGVWRTLYPDGTEIGVRTVVDFHTIGSLLGGSLASTQKKEMATFVKNELRTADWMRALSLLDPFANISSFRPDHGTTGSYDAWPAQTMDALVTMSLPGDALEIMKSIGQGNAPKEGPFGQARTLIDEESGLLCNTTEIPNQRCRSHSSFMWLMQGFNAAGAPFADVVISSFFGFQPPMPWGDDANSSQAAIFASGMPRGFDGELRNVQFRGRSCAITSMARAGLSMDCGAQ